MRMIAASLLLAGTLGAWMASPAQARDYRYCLYERYGEDCSFDTYAQCQASASGREAYCDVNRRFLFAPQPAPRHRKKHQN
jgi:hypothetical protein